MFRALILAAVLILSLLVLRAQQTPQLVQWQNQTAPISGLAVGDVVEIVLVATIAPAHHLYSAQQPTDAVLPAAFAFDKTAKGVELVGSLVEEGEREVYHDAIFEADIAQFSNKVVFRQKVKITAPQALLVGALSYQVCNDQMCIPGSYEVKYTIAAAAKKPKSAKRR